MVLRLLLLLVPRVQQGLGFVKSRRRGGRTKILQLPRRVQCVLLVLLSGTQRLGIPCVVQPGNRLIVGKILLASEFRLRNPGPITAEGPRRNRVAGQIVGRLRVVLLHVGPRGVHHLLQVRAHVIVDRGRRNRGRALVQVVGRCIVVLLAPPLRIRDILVSLILIPRGPRNQIAGILLVRKGSVVICFRDQVPVLGKDLRGDLLHHRGRRISATPSEQTTHIIRPYTGRIASRALRTGDDTILT